MKKNSFVTVTDQFCGAGGSSLGAVAGGAEVVMAMNHWKLAIETHNHNFPETAHDCTDISACDPRRYPSTDILITSPECTNHSLAKGVKRPDRQGSFFDAVLPDAAAERSRATMWDVPRFAEYHRYNIIIVENVPDARHWVMWPAWIQAMELLGYDHKPVYLNSMFCWPTPQSRDRMYVVFWRKGNPAPDLDFHPVAYCQACGCNAASVQSWKNPQKRFGKYKQQYVYCCPSCAAVVTPYYYAALNAIDWSLPIQRIGDRKQPLKEKTLARIRHGLEKFGKQGMLTPVNYFRPNTALTAPHPTQTSSGQHALVAPPFLTQTSQSSQLDNVRSVESPFPTQTTCQDAGVVIPPAMIVANYSPGWSKPLTETIGAITTTDHHSLVTTPFMVPMGYTHEQHNRRSYPMDNPFPTQTARQDIGMVLPPFIAELRAHSTSRGVDEPLATMCAGGGHHGLVTPPAGAHISSYYGTNKGSGLDDSLPTVTTKDRHGVVVPPFLVSYYGGRQAVQGLDQALPTVPTMALHYMAQPGEIPDVDDCGFRMLQPNEIQAAMAFPDTYTVRGNQREKIKQLGNAVTPPAMHMLIERCLATLR